MTEIANAVLPRLTAGAMALVNSVALPGPAERRGDLGHVSRDLDLGWVAKLFPAEESRRFNQPTAVGEGF